MSYEQCCCCTCGTITVLSSDSTHPTLIMKGIPAGREVFSRLRNAQQDKMSGAKLELDV
jgi:hypothetical protein